MSKDFVVNTNILTQQHQMLVMLKTSFYLFKLEVEQKYSKSFSMDV